MKEHGNKMHFDIKLQAFKKKLESYSPIGEESWAELASIVRYETVPKDTILLNDGEVGVDFYYIFSGALRAYYIDRNGDYYNKNLFLETDLAGSTVSCLQESPSDFTIEALEDTQLIVYNYKEFRVLVDRFSDLKDFYIAHLEQNWIVEKEKREISLVMDNATERYLELLKKRPSIDSRIPLHHIASHIGVTPTQLSRIRNSLKN